MKCALHAPLYRLDQASGEAITSVEGNDRVLGKWRSLESLARYYSILFEWACAPTCITIRDLCARYVEHAQGYYRRPDGTKTEEADASALSLREIKAMFGDMAAETFTIGLLKEVRKVMIARGLKRCVVNQRIGRVKRMFRWAASEELVSVEVFNRLAVLPGLHRHRSVAEESVPIQPIQRAAIDAVLPRVSPVVRAMIELQLVSGMRPGELVAMRRRDLAIDRPVSCYTPESHKTLHHGHHRIVFLGPKAQEILRPYLSRAPEAFLFSSSESVAWWRAKRRSERRSPITPSQASRMPKPDSRRCPRDWFSVTSYDRAIARACVKAGIDHWTANQLRHTTATKIEEEQGLEAAAAILGHKTIETTQIYAHARNLLAKRIAEQKG